MYVYVIIDVLIYLEVFMYKISLNPEINSNFRSIVNDYIDFSIVKKYKNNDDAWNSICAIMDRIDDIVVYLNQKELDNGSWNRCAFDFFEFIEQAGVLVECIDELYKIYDIEQPKYNLIFKNKIINYKYLSEAKKKNKTIKIGDSDYFKYIRSLSTIHPSKTDRHKEFQNADFEVSPYVVWNKGIFTIDPRCNGELVVVSYNNNTDELLTNKPISIQEIFNYIKYKYYSLNYLIKKVKLYYKEQVKGLRNKPIKKPGSFSEYNDYLTELLKECKIRFPDLEDNIKEVIDVFNLKISNKENQMKYNKYCEALKIGIKAIHRQLQNMDFKCESPIDNLMWELLVGKIYKKNTMEMNYSYPLSKIIELKSGYGDKHYAIMMYKELLPFFNNYITVTKNDLSTLSYNELYILSQIAIYLHELENDGLINKYISKTEIFR